MVVFKNAGADPFNFHRAVEARPTNVWNSFPKIHVTHILSTDRIFYLMVEYG